MRELLIWCFFVCIAGSVQAQSPGLDPDWQESEAPTPPAFSTDHLVAVDMPHYVSLKFGVDPATISVMPDGIVRYVMVAQNATGSVNAMYEGIRCVTGQVKSYARTASNGAWLAAKEPPWRNLTDNLPSKHALAFARQGACEGRTMATGSAADIVKALKK